ncbi:MAG: hypothetical protein ACYC4R_03955 [Anaerolineae bacterium]
MDARHDRSLFVLGAIVLTLSILVTVVGITHTTGGQPFDVENVFGDTVRIYGDGLYAYDAHDFAPVFRGSDLAVLVVAVPALAAALILYARKRTMRRRVFLLALLPIYAYYAASISLGVMYNTLHLAYILLFSASVFALIVGLGSLDKQRLAESIREPFGRKGLYVFLAFAGVALIVAWLPDIIAALPTGRPPVSLTIYTTSVTNVLDIGIIGPTCILTIFLLRNRSGMGYALAPMLLTLSAFVGIMVVSQTAFQVAAKVDLPLPVLITKTASFVVLALFATYFDVRFLRAVKEPVVGRRKK